MAPLVAAAASVTRHRVLDDDASLNRIESAKSFSNALRDLNLVTGVFFLVEVL